MDQAVVTEEEHYYHQIANQMWNVMRGMHDSHPYRISDLVRILSPLTEEQISLIPPIQLTSPCTPRDRLAVRCLTRQFPSLRLQTDFPRVLSTIYLVMQEIQTRGIQREGIFRLTKDPLAAQQILEEIIMDVATKEMIQKANVYDLALAIKMFTPRAFPNLITVAHLEAFQSANTGSPHSSSQVATVIPADYWSSLNPCRQEYLQKLVYMLQMVAHHESATKMSLNNLARVFAPNFFQHPDPRVEYQWLSTTIAMVQAFLQCNFVSSHYHNQ